MGDAVQSSLLLKFDFDAVSHFLGSGRAVKEVKKLITAGKKSDAVEALKKAMSALDKAAKKHVIKKGSASRKKSRLALAIAKLETVK